MDFDSQSLVWIVDRILVRAISYTVHGLIPASCVFADRYNREEVVRSLGKEINLNPPLILGQLPDTPEELLKLDQVGSRLSVRPSIRRLEQHVACAPSRPIDTANCRFIGCHLY